MAGALSAGTTLPPALPAARGDRQTLAATPWEHGSSGRAVRREAVQFATELEPDDVELSSATAAGISLQLSATGDSWNITHDGRLWFASPAGAPLQTFVGGRWHTLAAGGDLRFVNASSTAGSDSIGEYVEHSFSYVAGVVEPPPPLPHPPQSPQPCAVEFDVGGDYNGNDLNQTHAVDPLGCCAACAKEPRCKLWTFSNATKQCWLKSAKSPRRADPDRTSGTPNSPLNPPPSPPPGPPPLPPPAPPISPTPLILSFRLYEHAVMFTLSFPKGANGTNPAPGGGGWGTPSTRFPAFDLQQGVLAKDSGGRYLSFQGSGATPPIRGGMSDWYAKLDGWPGGGNGRNAVPLAPVFTTWQADGQGATAVVTNLDQV